MRFETLRPKIAQLDKLATLQKCDTVEKLDDIAPLLFQHTVYKSYPVSLVTKRRFDLLTRWLDGLTSHDLSQVDATGVQGFDDWFVRLEEQSPLRPNHSTGTTGKLSIVPRDVNEIARFETSLDPDRDEQEASADRSPVLPPWPPSRPAHAGRPGDRDRVGGDDLYAQQ
jgi:hypothetical protein